MWWFDAWPDLSEPQILRLDSTFVGILKRHLDDLRLFSHGQYKTKQIHEDAIKCERHIFVFLVCHFFCVMWFSALVECGVYIIEGWAWGKLCWRVHVLVDIVYCTVLTLDVRTERSLYGRIQIEKTKFAYSTRTSIHMYTVYTYLDENHRSISLPFSLHVIPPTFSILVSALTPVLT